METTEVKYAGFWTRFVAFSLDMIVISVTTMLLNLFLKSPTPDVSALMDTESFPQFLIALKITMMPTILSNGLIFLGTVLYWVLMTFYFGATLGKMAMGIKVVKEDLTPIGFGTAITREVLIKDLLYCVLFFISWLGYLWIVWDKKKQGWHDKISRTVVIKEEHKPSAYIPQSVPMQPQPQEQEKPQEMLKSPEPPKPEQSPKIVEKPIEPVKQPEQPKQEQPKQELPKQEPPKQEPPKSGTSDSNDFGKRLGQF